jgi:transcriptional regulator of NAD metabolism
MSKTNNPGGKIAPFENPQPAKTKTDLRRERLAAAIEQTDEPLSAAVLAEQLGVSRQVIVGDVALLRAEGHAILATPRGYLSPGCASGGGQYVFTVACRHTAEQITDELYAVVDEGGCIQDVTVEHAVYGQIAGQLQISSRRDVDDLVQALADNAAVPLSGLTGGLHLHTIRCADPAAANRIKKVLMKKEFLIATSDDD